MALTKTMSECKEVKDELEAMKAAKRKEETENLLLPPPNHLPNHPRNYRDMLKIRLVHYLTKLTFNGELGYDTLQKVTI